MPSSSPGKRRTKDEKRPLVVALTGASGSIYGIHLLQRLRAFPGVETHLVISRNAERVIGLETDWTPARIRKLADRVWDPEELAAPIASGSFRTAGMVIAPCSIKTLAAVAGCHAADLITRAADVTLKERRKLVLMLRETPLHHHFQDSFTAAAAADDRRLHDMLPRVSLTRRLKTVISLYE